MSERRDAGVDAVRGVALVSMYVAHCAPSDGPGNVLLLTEYLTYPLFALLVGVGAQLGARSAGSMASRWWVGALVRGAVLIAVAEGLERAGAQIFIVLAFLGVLTWIAWPVARCPTWMVAAIGGAALALAPVLSNQESAWLLPLIEDGRLTEARFLSFLAVGGPYQLMSMVFFAALGIVVTRLMTDGPLAGDRARLAAGWAVAAGWVGCLALNDLGLVELQPYEITYPVVVFDALLAVGCLLVVPVVAGWARCGSARDDRVDEPHAVFPADPVAGLRHPGLARRDERRLLDERRDPRARLLRRGRRMARHGQARALAARSDGGCDRGADPHALETPGTPGRSRWLKVA